MPSSKFRNVLLVAFAVLTIIFGSISAYEYIQVQQLKSSTITTSTTTVTSTPSTTYTHTYRTTSVITATATIPDEGEFKICFPNRTDCYFFVYKRISESDFPAGTSVTFKNVTFYNMPLNFTTSCTLFYIRITFPDGTSELGGAGYCFPPETSIGFSDHSNPTAGVMYLNVC